MAQKIFRDRPALALFVHAILGGNLDVVEEHLVHFMLAVHENQGTHSDASGTHIDQ